MSGNNKGFIKAGLPNITAKKPAFYVVNNITTTEGAFTCTVSDPNMQRGGGYSAGWGELGFDASLSNSIYGSSTTVIPETCQTYFIIKF